MAADTAATATPPKSGRVEPTRRELLRYAVFGKIIPCALYASLGYLQLGHLIDAFRGAGSDDLFELLRGPVRLTLYFLFCVIPVAIYVTRPLPRARDGSFLARFAAFAGTTMLLWVGAFDSSPGIFSLPPAAADAVSVILAVATALEVFSLLYLRRNLSIIPEARGLVRTGPYSVVRHPLYLSEILVAVAIAISGDRYGTAHLLPVLALPLFIALQVTRTHFEEALLRGAFAEYAGYARDTPRLIPFIW